MQKNFLKEWLNAIMYPMPVIWATKAAWEDFAENASYDRVKKAFNENCKLSLGSDYIENLCIILKRLSKGNWPKLSEEFVKKHSGQIYMVTSREKAMSEIKSYQFTFPLYLIDENHQMIGILIDKDTVVTGIVEESVHTRVARCLEKNNMLPTGKQIRLIGHYKEQIDKMMKKAGLTSIVATNCWLRYKGEVMVWGCPSCFRPVVNDTDLAALIFVL